MLALRRLAAAALSALCVCLSLASHAATLNVPSQYATIQAGVDAAVNGDTVLVADGTYTGAGNRDIDFGGKNITVQSVHGPTTTILDCGGSSSSDGSGSHRGFFIHSGETDAVIDGFTIKNGYTKYVAGSSGSGSGGGIYIFAATSVRVTDCTVTENSASSGNNYHAGVSGSGGGIFAGNYGNSTTGSILVTNCIVNHCTVVDNNPTDVVEISGAGGGVCLRNDGTGSVSMTGCTVTGNTAERGGGVYSYMYDFIFGSHTVSITDCMVNDNTASDSGGGIYDQNIPDTGHNPLLVSDCTVTGNMAASGAGGGIFNENGADTLTRVSDCTVTGNMASYGGGIFNDNYSDTPYFDGDDDDGEHEFPRASLVQVIGCAVSGNTVLGNGGGVYNSDGQQGLLQMIDCTVTGNTSDNAGGGVYNDNRSFETFDYDDDGAFVPSGGISTTACTIAGNSAVTGGGGMENSISAREAIADVTDCIVYNNLHGEVSNVANANSAKNVAVRYSDVQGGHSGTANIDADPLFVDAANGDFHLQAGSPCINKGVAVQDVATDKDGKARPDPPSIGAYEYAAALPAPTIGSLSPASKPVGSSAFTLTVHGMGFLSNSVVHWNGDALATTSVSSTKLTASVSASRLSQPGTEEIRVTSPSAVTSGGKAFFVSPGHIGIATAIAAGPDGKTRVLWTNTDGTATVWTLNADGSVASYGSTYGPLAGWAAKTISVGNDNATRILWTNTDGRMTIWTLSADSSTPAYGPVYGPYAGWTATGISTDFANVTHVLWTNTDGRMTLWTIPSGGSPTYSPVFGPFSGWTARAIAADGGGAAHVLWTNTDGRMTLWRVPATGTPTYGRYYGPYVGWTAAALSVDGNRYDHVLWNNTNGAMTLWVLQGTSFVSYSPVFGPYAGWSAVGLSVDTENFSHGSHVLWDNADGRMTPWTLDIDNRFVGTFPVYGPY